MLPHRIRSPRAHIDFEAIRSDLGIPDEYPADAQAEAEALAHTPLDQLGTASRADDRDIEFVTIDPAGSEDLDQAVCLTRTSDGYRVYYAITDMTEFVAPGSALDRVSRERGMTLYSPDARTPLYPTVLSEGAASLLPDQDRLAVLWVIDLDEAGEPVAVDVRRTVIRSRAKLDYPSVQADTDIGSAHSSLALLGPIGTLLQQAARRRHAIDLDLADAEVVADAHGHWTLKRRATLPVEKYNAQISLLTGRCAAKIMLAGKAGLLRTLPPPTDGQVAALRRATEVFGIPWTGGRPVGDVVSELDSSAPREAAFIEDAIRLLRGAGYAAFDGELPEQTMHAGVGAPYAHVTAPLRRLADRYATEICLSLQHGTPIPPWVTETLPELPGLMNGAAQRASRLDHACTDAVSEFLLRSQVGEVLTGIVVQIEPSKDRATVLLDEPPVRVRAAADGFVEGSRAAVRLTAVDPASHRIDVEIVR